MKCMIELKGRLLAVLPSAPHSGLNPYVIETEMAKLTGKKYTDDQYGDAVTILLSEKSIEENGGLFRKTLKL